MRSLIACCLLLLAGVALPAQAEGIDVLVADPYLELRTGPGRGYPINHVVPRGEQVKVLRRRTDWFRIRDADGREGWVHRDQMAETLIPAGARLQLDDPSREDFGAHRREIGVLAGDFGGANSMTVYGAYALNAHLSAEITAMQVLGTFSDGLVASLGLTHFFRPDWRIQPFVTLATGVIKIEPKATLVQAPDRTDQLATVGGGVRVYLARRFIIRGEYKKHVVFTDRDENEEANEWKIGFAFFF